MTKQTQSTGLSACHKAEMTVVGSGGGTMYYECNSCHSPCDMWSSTTQETTKQMEDWEKEFEEMNRNCDGAYGCGQFPPEVKSFVSRLLLSQKQEMLEAEGDRAEESWSEGIKEGKRQANLDLKKKIEKWMEKKSKSIYDQINFRVYNSVEVFDLQEFLKTL